MLYLSLQVLDVLPGLHEFSPTKFCFEHDGRAAQVKAEHRVIHVWDHNTAMTHGPAQIATEVRVYQLLLEYMGSKEGADIVFTTPTGEKVTHLGLEMEKLGDHFGKKLLITPTMNRKQIATLMSKSGSEADIRGTMSHSLTTHQMTYQQKGNADDAVQRYLKLRGCYILTHLVYLHRYVRKASGEGANGEGPSGEGPSGEGASGEVQEDDDEDMGEMLRRGKDQ